jgi:hypothetical protein
VKPFRWDPEKNSRLKASRGISYEQIVLAIEEGGLKDVLIHPNQKRYSGQVVLVVVIGGTCIWSRLLKRASTTS